MATIRALPQGSANPQEAASSLNEEVACLKAPLRSDRALSVDHAIWEGGSCDEKHRFDEEGDRA